MKDFMSKRLVPEERVDENIHARDGHEFFCVGCGQMLSLKGTWIALCGFMWTLGHINARLVRKV